MTRGYQQRRRAWRPKRRLRRGRMIEMYVYDRPRARRKTPEVRQLTRKHPHYRRFSFGNRIRGFGRQRGRKL